MANAYADSIFDAAWRGELENVAAFIAAGVSPSARYYHVFSVAETPMLLAADKGHAHVIDFLIQQHGVDPNEKDGDWKNALHYAVHARDRELVAHLLRHHPGCDPNAREREEGHTPLMAASQYGPVELVRVLLDDPRVGLELPRLRVGRSGAVKGVDEGATALWLAARAGQWATVELLVARGADPTVAGPPHRRRARTVLEMAHHASPGECPATVRDLVAATVADVERAQALHRLRSLNDAAEATQTRMAAVLARSGMEGQQRQTRSGAVAQMIDNVPRYLQQRMRRRRPMPRVEMAAAAAAAGEKGSKKRATGAQEAGHAGDPEERLRAVAAHVLLGGMVQAHVTELLELLAPTCLHLKEARRRAEADAEAAADEDA